MRPTHAHRKNLTLKRKLIEEKSRVRKHHKKTVHGTYHINFNVAVNSTVLMHPIIQLQIASAIVQSTKYLGQRGTYA